MQHLQVLWLLPELHEMLPVQLPLPPLVVLQLVLELSLVLQPDEVHAQLLQRVQLPVLQLPRGLVVPDQHCVLHLLLRPLLVQLLRQTHTAEEGESLPGGVELTRLRVLLTPLHNTREFTSHRKTQT